LNADWGTLVGQRNARSHDFFHLFNQQFDVFHDFFSFVSEVYEPFNFGNVLAKGKSCAKVATILETLYHSFVRYWKITS
jgi:hypothetical protein